MAHLFTTKSQFCIEIGTSLVSILHFPPNCGFNICVKKCQTQIVRWFFPNVHTKNVSEDNVDDNHGDDPDNADDDGDDDVADDDNDDE